MKILFINTLYSPHIGGGAEIVLQEQVEGLKKHGYEVVMLATKESGDLSKEEINGVKIYRAGIKNIYWNFKKPKKNPLFRLFWHIMDRYNVRMRKYVKTVIDAEQPDAVVCHNLSGWSISIWEVIKKSGLPLIQVLHDLYLVCPNSNMFSKNANCERQCGKCSVLRSGFAEKSRQIDVVVGVSHFILNRFMEQGYFKDAQRKVIYNQRSIPCLEDIHEWDGKRPLRFGFIGTLSEVKGVELLINAFMGIRNNTTLSIAGKGDESYENKMKEIARPDKRISFSGYVNPDEFYLTIDVLVVPSVWNDTLPGVAIEACANNVPVIASNMGGLPEIILHGNNGLIYDCSADQLIDAMTEVFNDKDLLNSLKRNAKISVHKFLNSQAMINDYEEAINLVSFK